MVKWLMRIYEIKDDEINCKKVGKERKNMGKIGIKVGQV